MSVTIYPYIDNDTTEQLQKTAASAQQAERMQQTSTEDAVADFQTYLQSADRTQQAMAVDALLAATADGSVSTEAVQEILGFNPQLTLTATFASSDTADTADAVSSSDSSSSSSISSPESLEAYFEEAAETYDVDIDLLKAIAKVESNFDTDATSSAGAMGVMQLMPSTAKSLGIEDAYDAHDNIMGGAQVIAQHLEKYDGDVSLALAAYNAGSGNVDKYGGIPPFTETQNYVEKVLSIYEG